MTKYNVQEAQSTYYKEIAILKSQNIELTEKQQASLFAKILVKQTIISDTNLKFCNNNELFVSKTPTGYDVVGYYIDYSKNKIPFNITVCKINNLWYPTKKYIAADTKSCSGYILLWGLLSLGCTLMGILMYFLISAAIGI